MTHPVSPSSPVEQPTTVAIYCRLSLDRNDTGLAVARQEEECRRYAEARGWAVGRVYVDNDISATSGKRRPAFEELLEDRPDSVVVWNLDRLARVSADLERVLDAGLTVYAIQAGHLDLSTPAGRAVARTVTAWSTYEGDIRSERQRSAFRQRAAAGKPWWSNRPFGYERDGSPREVEAAMVRQAYADVLKGSSLAEVARTWQTSGITTTGKATDWTGPLVKSILLNARNAGLKVYQGEVVGTGTWVPLVPEETWRGACTVLRNPARKVGREGGNKVTSLLSGIVRCGKCNDTIKLGSRRRVDHVSPNAKRLQHYTCPGWHLSIEQGWADTQVLIELQRQLPNFLSTWAAGRPGDEGAAARLRGEQAQLNARLAELAELFMAGVLTSDQVTAGTREARARLEAIDAELTELAEGFDPQELARNFGFAFSQISELDLGQRRQLVQAIFQRVELSPRGKGNKGLWPELFTYTTHGGTPYSGAAMSAAEGIQALRTIIHPTGAR